MNETAKKLVDATNELKDYMCTEMMSQSLERMSEEELKMAQLALKLVSATNNYIIESAKILDSINTKLDKVVYYEQVGV